MMPTLDSQQKIFLTCHGKTYKSILISYTSHVYFIKKKKMYKHKIYIQGITLWHISDV